MLLSPPHFSRRPSLGALLTLLCLLFLSGANGLLLPRAWGQATAPVITITKGAIVGIVLSPTNTTANLIIEGYTPGDPNFINFPTAQGGVIFTTTYLPVIPMVDISTITPTSPNAPQITLATPSYIDFNTNNIGSHTYTITATNNGIAAAPANFTVNVRWQGVGGGSNPNPGTGYHINLSYPTGWIRSRRLELSSTNSIGSAKPIGWTRINLRAGGFVVPPPQPATPGQPTAQPPVNAGAAGGVPVAPINPNTPPVPTVPPVGN